jgi:hypothetical protein
MCLWKLALEQIDKGWSVAWAPQRCGKDKRCWIRFTGIVDRYTVDAKKEVSMYADKIAEWYSKSKNHKGHIVSHFGTEAGPIIVLASPAQTDTLLNLRQIQLTGITKSYVEMVAGNQIEILSAFEVVISGIGSYGDALVSALDEWISHSFLNGPDSLFVESRLPNNSSDIYIFTMRNWDTTKQVSDVTALFEEFLHDLDLKGISNPMLLIDYNTHPPIRKRNLAMEINHGASKIAQQLKATEENLNKCMDNIEKSVQEASETNRRQF